MNINSLKIIIPLLVIIPLFIFIGKFGLAKVVSIRGKISLAQKQEKVLSQKFSLLTDVEETAASASLLTSSALPSQNPSLSVMSQIRIISKESALNPINIKSGASVQDKAGISRVDVSFDVEGGRSVILDFLKKVGTFAPITVVEKVKLNDLGGVTRAEVTLKAFYAEFPKKLPGLTEAINDLTNDEKNILDEILELRQPQFVSLTPSAPNERLDPFSP